MNWADDRPKKTRKGRWSQAEVDRLRDQYGRRDIDSIARDLGRSSSSVRKMADSLFRSASRVGPWTSQEVQNLKSYLGLSGPEVIARILGRDPGEVERQIFELGRIQHAGRWARDELAEFKRVYGRRTDEVLALIFGRGLDTIRRTAERYRLAKDKAFLKRMNGRGATRMPRWSAEEIELLKELYSTASNLEIAQRLNRSVKSVVSKAHHIGLKKDAERLREMGRENVSLRYNEQL